MVIIPKPTQTKTMKFIDNLAQTARPLVPVQLTHCLQSSGLSRHRVMHHSDYALERDHTYTRIGTMLEDGESFDIIKCEAPPQPGQFRETLYFGKWNDGVGTTN